MKFWNRLRWLAAIVFVLFLAANRLATDLSATAVGSTDAPVRQAPAFSH